MENRIKIEEIDKNFSFESTLDKEGLVWYDVRKSPFKIYGLHDPQNADVTFHRMPTDIAEATSRGVFYLNTNTSGGRVRFATNSPYIAIRCETNGNIAVMPHMPLSGRQGFDLREDVTDGSVPLRINLIPPGDRIGQVGFETVRNLLDDGVIRNYTLHFPLYGTCRHLAIGIKEGSFLGEGLPYGSIKPFVFYGSSITQGACVSRAGNDYASIVARRFNSDHINLGFSGSGNAEEPMLNYLASIDAAAYFFDYNLYDSQPDRILPPHYDIYKKLRTARPDAIIVLHDKPCYELDTTYERRSAMIRATYERAIAEGDTRVAFVEGKDLFGMEDRDCCSVDYSHPNDLGAMRFADALCKAVRSVMDKN